MNYCTTCFYPDTKPDIEFNKDGVCSACIAFEERKKLTGKKEKKNLLKLLKILKRKVTEIMIV